MSVLSLVAVLSSSVQTQTVDWTDSGNRWTYGSIGLGRPWPPHQLTVGSDTVIDGQSATAILQTVDTPYLAFDFYYLPNEIDTFYIQQRGDTLLYYVDSAFHVLYDFTLEAGDTAFFYIPTQMRNNDARDVEYLPFRVDSVGTMVVGDRTLRGQYLRDLASRAYPHYVEGALSIGWRYELLGTIDRYMFPYDGFYCDGICPFYLRCFSAGGNDNQGNIELKRVDYACTDVLFSTATSEPDLSASLLAYPNPATAGRELLLEWSGRDDLQDLSVRLFDPLGRELRVVTYLSGQQSLRLPLDVNLPVGLYTLVVRTPEGRAVKRILISGG